MSLDIAPDWLELAIGGYCPSIPQSQRSAAQAFPPPSCPDRDMLMALVRELCTEGTLSLDQMNMMFDSAELADITASVAGPNLSGPA
ncbi:hypothetical protein [Magnetospirillum molischianum]|uniref:Uncharacterized protein n=1 Tax=Magnetospirillum molischianum DSM 120 TaxID=1150626 RepID=H8FPK4_MAGML|nr:hypothetical protein [Magnetospirillum molischianum]CCG40292.1 conserved hypothetical protein [Magnetospirillum molischianum DSM 120]